MFAKKGESFDPVRIPKSIKDAGFTATEIDVTVVGVLVKADEKFELDVPGLENSFELWVGERRDALERLVGKRVSFSGRLEPRGVDQRPGIKVESFREAP